MKENQVVVKSKAFALRIIRLYRYLSDKKKEFVLSKQVLRSGTSIGANIRESQRGQLKADFYAKLYIALKEADETAYWLELLHESDFLTDKQFSNVYADCNELINLMVAHNHPSGDPTPSKSDLDFTRRLVELGRLAEVKLLDHLILGDADSAEERGFVSIRESGEVEF